MIVPHTISGPNKQTRRASHVNHCCNFFPARLARLRVAGPVFCIYIRPMVRARLSVADVLHRGVVLSLVGVCIWGIGTGVLVHRDTVRMGKGSHISSYFRSLS